MNDLKLYIEERIAFLKEENKNPRVNHYAVMDELQAVLSRIEEIQQQEFNSLVQC